jgi:hypothetical protein
MKKRGDLNISFNMIFSIIIIIAIIAVAFYVINSFMDLSKCSQAGLFYDDLKNYINKAWQAGMHKDKFEANLPSGIENVCFGTISQSADKDSAEIKKEITKYFINEAKNNVFLYPLNKACDGELSSIKLEHIETANFFCVPVKDGKITIHSEKTQFDSAVKITK